MKKTLVLAFTLLLTVLCVAQVDKAPTWHPDTNDFYQTAPAGKNITAPYPTGRIRTIGTTFVTIYSPKEIAGYVTQKEMKTMIGEEVYLYWEDIVYYRLIGPFKKRKEYQLREIYNPGL